MKERWLFADIVDPTELLKLNGQKTSLADRPLSVLTKEEYRQVRIDIKATERRLKLQVPTQMSMNS